MTEGHYDVAIIGGGPGGYVAAIRAAQLGLKTVLIERSELGGTCLNWGCIPTKALLRSAEVLRLTREAARYGVKAGRIEADLDEMIERSRGVAGELSKGVEYLLRKNAVRVIRGVARLKGRGMLEIAKSFGPSGKQAKHSQGDAAHSEQANPLSADHIIIATGARARELSALPIDGKTVWSYREALAPPCTPKRMLIIGAGAIGVEFASFYRAIGVEITMLEAADRILPAEDRDVSAAIAEALEKDGVTLCTASELARAEREGRAWRVEIRGSACRTLDVDVVLVAAGIVANTEDLGLENAEIQLDSGHIVVDEYCRTNEPRIYAIGDVAGVPWLAHKASHEGVMVAEHIAGLATHPLEVGKIPSCVYSHVQAARVGLTEEAAFRQGLKVNIGKFPFSANGKALATGTKQGFVKVVFEADSGELLGAHLVGHDVTEMIQGYAVAMGLETTEVELMRTVFPHPTMSESMHEAVLAAYGRVLHY